MIPVGFVAIEAHDRRRAISALSAADLATSANAFALRRLAAADGDVIVRAAAAEALGRVTVVELGADVARWLSAALDDVSPVVRDAAIRALARRREVAAEPGLRRLAAADPTWWVRRAAIYALGVIAGDAAIDPARAALADPFWRVRHAAIQVLAVRGHQAPERRAEILAEVDGGSADYLRALWGPALVDERAVRTPVGSRLPPELRDPDPAVVTARLAAMAAPPALAVVELLCDPHEALRAVAVARLREADDLEAFAAALNWLDEPRIPHVARTVTALLDDLGDPARALAARVLADPHARRGALGWAIDWVIAVGDRELAPVAWRCAVAAGLTGRALPLADAPALVALTRAEDPRVAIAAADELLARPVATCAAWVATLADPGVLDPEVRMRWVVAAAFTGAWDAVERATIDAATEVRAVALELLAAAGRLADTARDAALEDRDPMIREAALPGAGPDVLARALDGELDPWVRRSVTGRIVRAAHALDALRAPLAAALVRDADPWIRARAVALLGDDELDRVLALGGDPDPMVASALIDRLGLVPDAMIEDALARDAALSPEARAAARAWLDAGRLEDAIAAGTLEVPASRPRIEGEPPDDALPLPAPRAAPARSRRTFGRSGIAVAPLVISGAFDLAPGSLRAAAEAGVELFFWEPTYAAMTRFLRAPRQRDTARVVTGSYHADARSITRDVDSALRRLRRDTLDVFLLFWARSPARLDGDAFAVLDALKRAGKIHAAGFSTHDRALAIAALDAAPWDVVMTRHSAAHPGIEAELLPRAAAAGAGVLTFSALCYGRMVSGPNAPSPADCYRYSLAQPGVTACISAPRRHRELLENLEVVADPALPAERIAALRAHGAGVRLENQRFTQLVREPTRDAAAAAMAMLEAELAPAEERDPAACTPPASLGRSLSSRGRGRASLPSAMLRRGRL